MIIKEAYCSYEVAKLLKEKGFDVSCRSYFIDNVDYINSSYSVEELTELNMGVWETLRPTHQMAMAWLRERYNLFFGIGFGNDCNGKFLYMIDIYDLTNNAVNGKYKPIVEADDYLTDNPKTYEEAIEAALKYTLENLI